MAMTVDEVMNRELFTLPGEELAERAVLEILGLGITAAPILDGDRRPVGVASLRDLIGSQRGPTVADRMTRPAVTVRERAGLEEAARLIAMTGVHHLVVVDNAGVAVGFVSALDLLRGLVGLPATHPPAFPHMDPRTGLTWTDVLLLDMEQVEAAPDGPGLYVLIHGGVGRPETVVWADAANNVRARLIELLSTSGRGQLSEWLERGELRFRAALVSDPERREELAEDLRMRASGRWFEHIEN